MLVCVAPATAARKLRRAPCAFTELQKEKRNTTHPAKTSMSEPRPPHKKYTPSERSPLGQFGYTAADIEKEVEAEAEAARALAVVAGAAETSVDTLTSGIRRPRDVENDDKDTAPPTKRPKLDIGDVEKREKGGLITGPPSSHICGSQHSPDPAQAHAAPARMGVPGLWSFRALEEDPSPDAEVEDEDAAATPRAEPTESGTEFPPAEQSARPNSQASHHQAIDPGREFAYQLTTVEASHGSAIASPRAIAGQAKLPYDAPALATRHKRRVEPADEAGLGSNGYDKDQPQPDSPGDVPAGPSCSNDGIGRLSKPLKVGDAWS